jgi:hypothetical protein
MAALWMGLGACFKAYPFLLLPPLVLILGGTWWARIRLLLVGTLPYVLLLVPVIGRYPGSSLSFDGFLGASYDLALGARVYLFFAVYAALLWYLYTQKARAFEDLWHTCFAILLIYGQLVRFDLHYWVWIVPFAVLYAVQRPRQSMPFYIAILAGLAVLAAPTPLARFLAPISPRFFLRLPSAAEVAGSELPVSILLNIGRSLLAGTCFFLAWCVLREMPASGQPKVAAKTGGQVHV